MPREKQFLNKISIRRMKD